MKTASISFFFFYRSLFLNEKPFDSMPKESVSDNDGPGSSPIPVTESDLSSASIQYTPSSAKYTHFSKPQYQNSTPTKPPVHKTNESGLKTKRPTILSQSLSASDNRISKRSPSRVYFSPTSPTVTRSQTHSTLTHKNNYNPHTNSSRYFTRKNNPNRIGFGRSAFLSSSLPGSRKLHVAQAANQPTTVILPTYPINNNSLPTTKSILPGQNISYSLPSHHQHQPLQQTQSQQHSYSLLSPQSPLYASTNSPSSTCIKNSKEHLLFYSSSSHSTRDLNDTLHQRTTPCPSTDTKLNHSLSKLSRFLPTEKISPKQSLPNTDKNKSEMSVDNDQSKTSSAVSTDSSIPFHSESFAVTDDSYNDVQENTSGIVCSTPKKSFPYTTDHQQSIDSSLKVSPFLVAENQIDLDLPQHIMSQSTPQSSPVKARPINTPKNIPTTSLLTATPPTLLFSAKKKLTPLNLTPNSYSPITRISNRQYLSPNRMARPIGMNTAIQSPLAISRNKALMRSDNDVSNPAKAFTDSLPTNVALNSSIFGSSSFKSSSTTKDKKQMETSENFSITTTSKHASSNTNEIENTDIQLDISSADLTTTKSESSLSQTHHTQTDDKQAENFFIRNNAQPKGVIKNIEYRHFDLRENVPRHKTVRFDPEILESRLIVEESFDDEDDSLDQEEQDEAIQKQSSLMAQFERDFCSESENEDDDSREDTSSELADQNSAIFHNEADTSMTGQEPKCLPNAEGAVLDQESGHETALLHEKCENLNGQSLTDSTNNDPATHNQKDETNPSVFPDFDLDQESASDSDESYTEQTRHLDFGDPDYDLDDDISFHDEFEDDYDEEEQEYMYNERLDYPDGDVAHSNKLLNRNILEDSLPPLQSHHQIRAAIQTNVFKNVIIETIESLHVQMDTENEHNTTNDTSASENSQSLFKPSLFSSRDPPRTLVSDEMLDSYAGSMAQDFFKWVSDIQQNGSAWDDAVKQFEKRKIQYGQNDANKDTTTEAGVNAPVSLEANEEFSDEISAGKKAKDDSVKPKDNEKVVDHDQDAEMTDSGDEKQLESSETADLIKSNQEVSESHNKKIDPAEQGTLQSNNDDSAAEPDTEQRCIDPFSVDVAADILRQGLVLFFEDDSLSFPWLTKSAFSRIFSCFKQADDDDLYEEDSESGDDDSDIFTSLQDEIRHHEDQGKDGTHSLIYDTTNRNAGSYLMLQRQRHGGSQYIRAHQVPQGQFVMSSSHFGTYRGTSSIPFAHSRTRSLMTKSANDEELSGYENQMGSPSSVTHTAHFSGFTSIRSGSQLAGRKRLRSADNLYYQHQLNKNLQNDYSHLTDSVINTTGRGDLNELYPSRIMNQDLGHEFVEAEYLESSTPALPQPTSHSVGSTQEEEPLETVNNPNLEEDIPKPPALKRRCSRPLTSQPAKHAGAGAGSGTNGNGLDATEICDPQDPESVPSKPVPAFQSLSCGPLATSSMVEVLDTEKDTADAEPRDESS